MADTKKGREKQAARELKRQQEREIAEARRRGDEAEPPASATDDLAELLGEDDESPDSPRACHRRGCDEPAAFLVLERYQEETGQGAVEAAAALCRTHAAEERPANLDAAYTDYVFRVVPLPVPDETDAE